MSSDCTRDLLKASIARILVTIGWQSSMSGPLELLTDILTKYMEQLAESTNKYANHFGLTEPNPEHAFLAYNDLDININDLSDYVRNVQCVDPAPSVPIYPLPKEDHLNFLKPGSKEVVTRPVHIHEHLPPMFPLLEVKQEVEEDDSAKENVDEAEEDSAEASFKKPAELSSPGEPSKRPKLLVEEETRPIREISSVIMTTSGFLSPAREGRLPEARTPLLAIDPPPPNVTATQPESIKKSPKPIKKLEKRKEKIGRELFKPISPESRKLSIMKEMMKNRIKTNMEASCSTPIPNLPPSTFLSEDIKMSPIPMPNKATALQKPFKFNKALEAARLKTEKLNTTITPIPSKTQIPAQPANDHVDKLLTEPDKKKVNIFKKISNVKNEKPEKEKPFKIKEEIKEESRESSPDLVIDETPAEISNKVRHLSSDITIELINTAPATLPSVSSTCDRDRLMFDDYSPPNTPSTPKTPDMVTSSPPVVKEKRKRKDKSKLKKKQSSPMMDPDMIVDLHMERPKTPEALGLKQEKPDSLTPSIPFPFTFHGFAGGPGLIPPPLASSLFSHLAIPPLIPSFGQPPFIPPVHPGMPIAFRPPVKMDEPVPMPSSSINNVDRSPPVVSSTTSENSHLMDEFPMKLDKKKEHKKDKKDKLKKKNKKDKFKDKSEKRKLKEERKEKLKIKREKKEKRKEKEQRAGEIVVPKLTLKLRSPSPVLDGGDTRKLNIKPIIKKDDEEEDEEPVQVKREMSPELAKISALVTGQPKPKSITPVQPSTTTTSGTKKEDGLKEEPVALPVPTPRVGPGPGRPRIHPIKPKPAKRVKPQQPMVKDAEGNQVWICPACGRQDDGTPMIGCDDCDAWYHWVCVGIQIPPEDSEDWYCKQCITKKQEHIQTDKKKKRKKRERKDH